MPNFPENDNAKALKLVRIKLQVMFMRVGSFEKEWSTKKLPYLDENIAQSASVIQGVRVREIAAIPPRLEDQ